MKILFDHPSPFKLAHGGFQIQIEQTKSALESIGASVEFLRWWDDQQPADMIHYFGRPSPGYIQYAHQKGLRVILAQLLTGVGSRGPLTLTMQKLFIALARRSLPTIVSARFGWDSFRMVDACLANTAWEAQLMCRVFGAPPSRVHILPNGVEETFLHSSPRERGKWLVSTVTITERKRVLELAEAAVVAQTPVWVIGKPYSESDSYALRFMDLARRHPNVIRYEGPIQDRTRLAQVYREARGFVLLSTMETRSLAAEEAAACECPLLLSDLPWARSVFGQDAWYCAIMRSAGRTAEVLRAFYDQAPALKPPPKPMTWIEVATQLKAIYETVLNTSR